MSAVLRTSGRLPVNWRDRLANPAVYYAGHLGKLAKPDANGWAQARCPFHDDHGTSLRVHVGSNRGLWQCTAGCGRGDMVTFHERITGSSFVEAVRDLIGLEARR